jgi:hypothetical protein
MWHENTCVWAVVFTAFVNMFIWAFDKDKRRLCLPYLTLLLLAFLVLIDEQHIWELEGELQAARVSSKH